MSGELSVDKPLPSVRQLAHALGIAPGTVARAYQALVAEGILHSHPRRGFFAAPADGEASPDARPQPVADLIDEAVRAAAASGLEPKQFLRLVVERMGGEAKARPRVGVVGKRDGALEEWTSVVARALSDLDVSVVSISYEELEAGAAAGKTSAIEWFIVPMLETRFARELLGAHAQRILPMTRTLRADVREFVRVQPPSARFGIIAVTADALHRTVAAIRQIHPLRVPPLVAVAEDYERVSEVMDGADVLVIGPQALRHLREHQPLRQPWVTFVFVPDDSTIQRLRSRLLLATSPSSAG